MVKGITYIIKHNDKIIYCGSFYNKDYNNYGTLLKKRSYIEKGNIQRNPNRLLNKYIKKVGFDNIKYELIEGYEKEPENIFLFLKKEEQKLIDKYQPECNMKNSYIEDKSIHLKKWLLENPERRKEISSISSKKMFKYHLENKTYYCEKCNYNGGCISNLKRHYKSKKHNK